MAGRLAGRLPTSVQTHGCQQRTAKSAPTLGGLVTRSSRNEPGPKVFRNLSVASGLDFPKVRGVRVKGRANASKSRAFRRFSTPRPEFVLESVGDIQGGLETQAVFKAV